MTSVPRVPPLPHQLDHVTSHAPNRTSVHAKDDHLDVELEQGNSEAREILELQHILSDPSNYVEIVAEEVTKAGMSEDVALMAKESEIILERIDQQLLELGPFAKDTFLSPPPIVPKDDPGAFPITFLPPNYVPYPPPGPGMEVIPMATSTQGRNRRRGGRAPLTSQHGMAISNAKMKRNSRSSETGSACSPMASTPVEQRVDLGMDVLKERDSASPVIAAAVKEQPKSKWRKVGSAGTAAKPALQSRSSSDRLQNNLRSPVLDRLSSPISSSAPVMPAPVHAQMASRSHGGPPSNSSNSSSIIQPASEFEMGSLFSSNQWELIESPPQRERDLSSTTAPSNHLPNHHLPRPPPLHPSHPQAVARGRRSMERDGSTTHATSSLNSEMDRHHEHVIPASRVSGREPRRTPTPQSGADPIPRPFSRPHSHSSSPPSSHPHPPPHHHQPTPPHSDIHTLLASTSANEISRHLVVSGGTTVMPRPPGTHLVSARETHDNSPLVTSATLVHEERTHANSASPLGNVVDGENPLVDRKRRNSSASTSSHRSGRIHSFDEGSQHPGSSPRVTKPQMTPGPRHHQQNVDQAKQPTTGGVETKIGGPGINPYALWGGVSAGQFHAPGQVMDAASTTAVPRFPFPPTAAPFLPGSNWLQGPGGIIATAAPGIHQVRPAMLPFDPNSPYKTPFLGAPFLAAAGPYRYSLPPGPGLKAFPGLTGVSAGNSPGSSSHPGTPTATVAMPFTLPGLPSGSTLSAFKSLNDAGISNRSSPPILHAQHLGMPTGKDDKQQPIGAGGEIPSMDKIPGLNMMQQAPPGSSTAAAALMAGPNLHLMPYLGMNQMPFSIGGIQPTSLGQQTPGGVNLFNPRLSTLATGGVHTGSEGNLTALGTSKEVHRGQQRRGSAASVDLTGMSAHNDSPPNQVKKGFPLRNETPPTSNAAGSGGKWKPVTENSPPISQMLFTMSASPSTPFAQSMIDSRALPNSSHLMTSALGQMLPLSFGTPPTHQQMRGGKGVEGAGRGSPRGTPDKMKLRIHQVKNDDFKMQNKPDRRRRRWKKGQEVLTTTGPAELEKLVAAPPPSTNNTQTAAQQLRRVRSDTVRKMSSTPPAVSPLTTAADDKDEVVDVGDSSDNNYALNMLATMSTMQSREQNSLEETASSTATAKASPLTISTSIPSSEASKNALLHSPVSLAGAKSLLMLGKDMHVKEALMKSGMAADERATEDVSNVESTAVDSLLQLSGAMLQDTPTSLKSTGHPDTRDDGVSKDDDFSSQRRETRSASYSAAEAILMMGSASKETEESNFTSNDSANEQQLPLEVFSNRTTKLEKPLAKGDSVSRKKVFASPCKSTKPHSLSIDSEGTDTDSEATLTPQSPAKRLPSYSTVEEKMEGETGFGGEDTDPALLGVDTRLKEMKPGPPPAAAAPKEKASMEDRLPQESEAVDHDSGRKKSAMSPQQPTPSQSESTATPQPIRSRNVKAAPLVTSSESPNASVDGGVDDLVPHSKRLKLCQDANLKQVENEAHSDDMSAGNEVKLVSETDVGEQTDVGDATMTNDKSSAAMPVVEYSSNASNSEKEQPDEVLNLVEGNAPSSNSSLDVALSRASDKAVDETDKLERKEVDCLPESVNHSPTSTDKVTSWSAFAKANCDEVDEEKNGSEEKAGGESKMETNEAPPSPPPPPPPRGEETGNQNVEKLKIDPNVKRSSISSASSPPFTPDPPIEVNVFDKLPPSPKSADKQQPNDSETAAKENPLAKHEETLPINGNEDPSDKSTTTGADHSSGVVSSAGVLGGPQNRLVVSRPNLNRLQHRKHIAGHSSKPSRDSKGESRKRLRPPNDSQARLFEVDTITTSTSSMTSTTTTPPAPPTVHSHTHHSSHSLSKEKKSNNEKAVREEPHQDGHHSPHHTSVRKLKRPGHSSSKSSAVAQKTSKLASSGEYTPISYKYITLHYLV